MKAAKSGGSPRRRGDILRDGCGDAAEPEGAYDRRRALYAGDDKKQTVMALAGGALLRDGGPRGLPVRGPYAAVDASRRGRYLQRRTH